MGVVFRPDPRRAARNKNRTGWQRPLVMRSMMRSTYDAKPPPGSLADFVTDIRPAYSPALASPELTALPAPAHPVGRSVEPPGLGIVRSPGGTRGTTGRHRCSGKDRRRRK